MVGALFLLMSVLLITFFAYYLERGDIFSPSVLICLVFFLSSCAALYNAWSWNAEIHVNTVIVILFGILTFIVFASFFGKSFWLRNRKRLPSINTLGCIEINRSLVFAITIFGLLISAIYVKTIYDSSSIGGSWSDTMARYRSATAYGLGEGVEIPTWLNYSYRLFMAFDYVLMFAFVNNFIVGKKANWLYLVSPIVYCASSFSQASRGQVLIFLFAGLVMAWVILQQNSRGQQRVPFKYVPIGIIALLLVLVAFVAHVASI